MLISIVIPCYYSEKTIQKVVEMTIEEFSKTNQYDCEFVLVNDGSTDGTYEKIKELAGKYPFVQGVNLLRNFGQHNALMAALHYVRGDYVLGMDDDMQTHPSQIHKLVEKIQEGYDLVYGHYGKRKNAALKNLSSKLNEVSSRILLGRPKEIVSSNFWIITRKVAQEVIKYESYNPYIDGIFYRVTHNIGNVEVEHHKREVGTSNYTLKKLIRLWLAYWNYSVIPLRISSVTGGVMAMAGFIAAILTIIRKLVHPGIPVGWASTICVITVFAGMILMSLGIIGEYLGKIILTLNHTPQFIVRESVNTDGEEMK
ncbi:MAG: glycosyltransferase family 2 protein [Blautia sp.]